MHGPRYDMSAVLPPIPHGMDDPTLVRIYDTVAADAPDEYPTPWEEVEYFVAYVMNDFEARPHWGKAPWFLDSEVLRGRYPRWGDFIEVRRRLDPAGTFLNGPLRARCRGRRSRQPVGGFPPQRPSFFPQSRPARRRSCA